MQSLINAIRTSLPAIVNEFNTIRLPALEQAWGRSFEDEWANEDPKMRTAEIAKVLSRPINNILLRHIQYIHPEFVEASSKKHDWKFGDIPIEDKNSFSDGDTWTGNGFGKTDWHLLKKFKLDKDGKIVSAFVALVDISHCKGSWTEKNVKSNFSSLKFLCSDKEFIHVIHGSVEPKVKYLRIQVQPVDALPQTEEMMY